MDLYQLKYFIEIAELGNITNAAEKLHITQPALSKSIARLEEEIGVKLFDRVGRHIALSRYGNLFMPYAQKVVSTITEAEIAIKAEQHNPDYFIRILTTPLIKYPGLLQEMLQCCNNINIISKMMQERDIVNGLLSNTLDLCIVSREIDHPKLKKQLINTEKVKVLISKENPMAKLERVPIKVLNRHKLVILDRNTELSRITLELFSHNKMDIDASAEVESWYDLINYVQTGSFFSLIGEQTPITLTNDMVMKDLDDTELFIKKYLYSRLGESINIIKNLREVIADYFEKSKNIESNNKL